MSDHVAPPDDEEQLAPAGSWLEEEIDGRPVRFWVLVGLAIAAVTLGLGAWWVWVLDRGTGVAGAPSEMGEMATDARLPALQGFSDGQEVFFVHPEASDPELAGILAAANSGQITLEETETVVDVPFLTWPGGRR